MSERAFHALHHTGKPLLLPNAWDFASAVALAGAGFAAVGTTSLGVAAAAGLPDGDGLARAETVALMRRLRGLRCPVTVDIESGFSEDPAEVGALAAELAELGAAGVNIEDGRPHGTLADPGHQAELIAAVKRSAPGLFVNARVDTYWSGMDALPAGTIERALRYLAAGADGIFVPGPDRDDHIGELVSAIPAPVNILFLPHRHTLARLTELGVRRISTGSLLFRVALRTAVDTARAIRDNHPVTAEAPSYQEVDAMTRSVRTQA
ncbi:isocitrate lyase/phosphoenolpyruvate mutase family protein [Actinophytocola sp.]|uniref:isocitrate lyase/PEP mutase family protein n=1 Tax=Actinophytocola sp. TaxID=1872138 RepID=UPI002D7F881C|nr:isocitrate lyase/phosphoenolpyruvate mutase family protein [Actinophytocola sp.]HET9140619.1 isocitrate lyase/phosphoenolpyruvate mutase family protein [Actinophytocola sp.]